MPTSKTKKPPATAMGKKVSPGRDAMKVFVAAIMSKKVKTVAPDCSLEAAMGVMLDKEIGHLPIVDDDGVLLGIVSKTDLMRDHFINGDTHERPRLKGADVETFGADMSVSDGDKTVSEVMSTRVKTVLDTATVAEAAFTMAKFRIHGLPVVTKEKVVVGFVSTFDIAGWVATN